MQTQEHELLDILSSTALSELASLEPGVAKMYRAGYHTFLETLEDSDSLATKDLDACYELLMDVVKTALRRSDCEFCEKAFSTFKELFKSEALVILNTKLS